MSEYTIICATNRLENRSLMVAEYCKKILNEHGYKTALFPLHEIPDSFSIRDIYNHEDSPLQPIVEKFIFPASKFIFILPEYNGSYPGILKVFIDAIHPKNFRGKKALLIGISAGRAGNLRGMDHLTGVLHYLSVEVYSNKLPISSIEALMDDNGTINDASTIQLLNDLIDRYTRF